MSETLTNLATVKAWLTASSAPATTTDDVLLTRLIRASSAFILNYLGRAALGPHDVVDVVDGSGHVFMVLREFPAISVNSIGFDGQTITAPAVGNPRSSGYLLERIVPGGAQQRLSLFGWCFPRGRSNVTIDYRAGYLAQETQTVPSAPPYTITTYDLWVSDEGVTLANGTALTKVVGSPAALQYAVSSAGVYTFNSAQAGAEVLISYGYIPADIVQAATELVGERYKAKGRIGVNSQSLAGKESITYYQRSDMSAWMTSALQPYRRTTPA